MDAIHAAGQAGIIFVCAAGNSSEDNDISPFFPADYPLDNIITVGASDNRDLPVYFSNYGSGSVEIFAPGENILSTYNGSNSDYEYLSGTSMAAPFVTGTVALLRAQYGSDTYRETINRILNGADPKPGIAGKAQTGGRLDLANSLRAANTPPNMTFAGRTTLSGLDPYTRSNNADSAATPEQGTPQIQGMAGGHSLWWQWTAPENATVEIDTSGTNGGAYFTGGSTYPTLLGVYTGTSLASLSPVPGGSSADYGTEPLEGGGSATYSEVSFHTQAGVTYQVNVQGQGGASGQTILAINTDPDYDSISTPDPLSGPSVSLLDANVNASLQTSEGEPRILGNAGGHSLWYSWTAPHSGPAQVSVYSYDFTPEVAVYTGSSFGNLVPVATAQGSADAGTTTDISECACAFQATQGTAYLIQVDGVTADDVGEFFLSVDDSLWQTATGDAVTCSPAVGSDGTVYVGSNDNSFYAFNPDGSVKWSYAAKSVFDTSSAAIGSDGTIYAGCTDGNVYAFNPSGSLRWTYTVPTPPASSGLDNGLDSSPAIGSDGTIYIHADDGNLYALTPAGAVKWTAAVAGFSYAAPTIAPDGTIYIGTDGGLVYAFNSSGSVKWTFTAPVAGDEIYTAAALDASGNLYFGTLDGYFYSVNSSGSLRWTYSIGYSITSAPALANGAVYFGCYDANLYSLTAATGAVNWKYALGAQVRASAPAVDANGVVYIGCYDHNVYAVASGGSLVRTYATDDVVRSSPVISGGMLYFGSEDHKVYAFSLGAGAAASDWPMYQFNAQRLGRAVTSSLSITAQPASQTIAAGSTVVFAVGATGTPAPTYQWYLNGTAVASATGATLVVNGAGAADAGSYTCVAANSAGQVTSSPAVLTVVSTSNPGRLVNISCRAQVGTGGNVLIAGFVVGGAGTSGTEPLLIRASGPALAAAPFDVPGTLPDPELELNQSNLNGTSTLVATNNGWVGNAQIGAAATAVGAFAWTNPSSHDAALLDTLDGPYTAQVSGESGDTGVALAEVYDDTPAGTYTLATPRLVNISARVQVGTGGNVLIAGFVVGGSTSETVLIRASGPALAAAPFNVPGTLPDPELQLNLSNANGTSTLLASNAVWGGAPDIASAAASVGAFTWTNPSSSDSAILVTLPPGAYTAQVSGASGDTGVALVEVYEVP